MYLINFNIFGGFTMAMKTIRVTEEIHTKLAHRFKIRNI